MRALIQIDALHKLVYFDGTGVCLLSKRLEDGKFCWPAVTDGVARLTAAQLRAVLEGLEARALGLANARSRRRELIRQVDHSGKAL